MDKSKAVEVLRDIRSYIIRLGADHSDDQEAIEALDLAIAALAAEDAQPAICTCPSGDGSLRWPCPKHPPAAQGEPVAWRVVNPDGTVSKWATVERLEPPDMSCYAPGVRFEYAYAHASDAKPDIYEAYKTWPADIRVKLSLHDLRRMNGWAPRTELGDWKIDTSAGGPILTYKGCSVIEAEDARYILNLIEKDAARYSGCCDTPAYCSSVRRCTAKDTPPADKVRGLVEEMREYARTRPDYAKEERDMTRYFADKLAAALAQPGKEG